ncbi:DUF6538 domain-containing protein [Sphingomonas sp. UNC305MFCol5.2]|uniref:DUF6538 domain-containing protein n=1 Tax=Sphingomonas sp. UNC305MFCol5.2 TaxID=1449076 RepID=UPI000675DCF8|nr:DUF6538 domain-containing protein [Sphingomonas sp. UNC305MFCol5.2]
MCTFLAKRNSTYYFRRVVPAELRPFFGGRREWMVSLGTKDRDTAKRLIPDKTKETDRLLDEALASLGRVVPSNPSSASQPMNGLDPFAGMSQEAIERQLEHEAAEGRLAIAQDDAWEEAVEWEAALPPDHPAARLLRDAREERDRYRGRYRRRKQRDRHDETPPKSPGEAPQGASAKQVEEIPGVMLDPTIVDLWAAERKVVQKGIDTHRGVVRWFYERVGKKPVDQITRKDVLSFKDSLIADNTAANTNMKLSRLQTLLQWAEDNDYREGNPAKGVRVLNTDAAKNKRKPFDIGSLNAIFSSPVYSEEARPTQGRGEAAYWLPLLALFTGARLEELGQLRPVDVQLERYPDDTGEERSAWFIHIREDDEDNLKLKNAASERVVPVHPELQRLGFVAFVEAAKKVKQARLFPLLKPNIYGRLTAKWGEWFGPYLRKTVGITDKRLVFHSFRHTFKDYARHAGIVEGVQRQIMGHSPGDVADEYGSGYSLHQLVEGMKLYKVPGLKVLR